MTQTKDTAGSAVATGLRGVVAAASSISDVNGEKGELIYQGVNIHDLATKSTFEEVVFCFGMADCQNGPNWTS